QLKVTGQGLNGHGGAVGFTVYRVAGNVGGADPDFLVQIGVNVGLVFPNIEDYATEVGAGQALQEGLGGGDFAPGGVDDDGAFFGLTQGVFVEKVPGGIGSAHV